MGWAEGEPELFRSTDASLKDLEELFRQLHARGITPLTVGAKYIWPLAALLQHITLSENPELQSIRWNSEAGFPREVWSEFDIYERWIEMEWIHSEHLQQDWPVSVLQMVSGDAAFVLIPSSLSSTIPLERRTGVGIIPFLSGPDQNWIVGSLWFLAVPEESEYPKLAEEFAEYLRSPDVSQRLQDTIGRRFFARDEADTLKVLESVTNNLDSVFMQQLRKKVRGID